jgi:hypothetical protein
MLRDVGTTLLMFVVPTLLAASCALAPFVGGGPANGPTMTWTVKDGTSRTFQPQRLTPDDRFRCSDGGGTVGVPEPGSGVGNSSGISADASLDGSVTVTCRPGPPGSL